MLTVLSVNMLLNKALVAVIACLMLGGCAPALAYSKEVPGFPVDMAIKSLAGEAGGQSMPEIIAHAHAIRNRVAKNGSFNGIYGLRAKVTPEALKRAKKGYLASLNTPSTVGLCDHWLSDYDLKHSRPALIAWRYKAVYSVKVGETTFYRLKG